MPTGHRPAALRFYSGTMHLHPIKTETFDVRHRKNVDPKGFLRDVDTYAETSFGLYMARPADHPQFGYLESWLLPDLGLRVSIFHFRPGCEKPQDFYVDAAHITQENGVWITRDLYLDVVSLTGKSVEVLDTDELAAATAAGFLSAEECQYALEVTFTAVSGIAQHHNSVMKWLHSQGIELTWAQNVTLAPPLG